ncbi:hypothetical protein M758_2G063100 [Ceratodon purpureus]|nr:hypothetical protein M758_2G063100 [Ceratodon purpureus]
MKEEKRKSERRAREERGRKRGRAREVRGRRGGPLEPTAGRCFHLSSRATKQLGRSDFHFQSSLGSRRPKQRHPEKRASLQMEEQKKSEKQTSPVSRYLSKLSGERSRRRGGREEQERRQGRGEECR